MLKLLVRRCCQLIAVVALFAASSTPATAALRRDRTHAAHHHATRRRQARHASIALPNTTSSGTASALLGDEAVESQHDYLTAGQAEVFSLQATASATAGAIHLYIGSHNRARTVVLGIYGNAGGHPGSLLTTGSGPATAAGTWTTVPVTPSQLTSGTTYWLAILGEGGTLRYRDRNEGPCPSQTSAQTNLGGLPASWRTGGHYTDCPVSAFVTPAVSVEPPPVEPPPPPAAPVDHAPPAISGTAMEGQTLSASKGTWSGSPTSYAYQWQDCNALGEGCLNSSGATAPSHTLQAIEVGDTVRVVVTAGNEGGSTPASSTTTEPVASVPPPPPPPAPTNTTLPTITGTTAEGQTLTASEGAWEGSPTSYTYQWQDCNTSGESCSNAGGATKASYTLSAGDVGHTIRVSVTATNEGGSTSATSAATATIAAVPPPPPPPPSTPTNTAPPAISGTTTEGQTLTASEGAWEGSPTSSTYQWQDCNTSGESCSNAGGATKASYTLSAGDVGHTIRVSVTATNEGGSTSATSAATATVTADPPPPPPGGLFISPTGKDSNPCTEAEPCLTMSHAYEKATAGQTVWLLAGSYSGQTIPGVSKSETAHVVFAPASGASVTIASTIYVFGSHVTIEGMTVQDVTIGNYDQEPGRPNPTDVTLLNLTGRNFEIDSATHVTVEGGSWGPASACGGPYGGGNNSIRQPIAGVAPEDIVINDTVIHDVQSYNLVECHIEGLAIFAGNHVTVGNTKFYGNSVYDVFMQANSGGSPDNITLKGNWFAAAMDNSGANGQPVGSNNGVAVGNELSENVTLEGNHFNDVLNMDDAEDISQFSNVHVLDNVGIQPYSGYDCGGLSGIEWSKNIWQNDKCGASDVDLDGAALPYINTANNSTLNYTLTGKYANWPEEATEEKKEESKKEEGTKEEGGSTGTLYLSPSGSNSAACTQSAPCKTLAHAYEVASAGATVQLAAGTYTDTSLPLTSGKTSTEPVVFQPAAGATVKFSKMLTVEAHGVELKGFTFAKELYFGDNAEGDTARDNALHNFEIISSGTKAPKDISIVGGTAGPVADGSDNENNLIATNGPETTAVPTKITIEGVLIHEYTKVGEAHVDCLQIWGGDELLIQDNTFKRCSVFDIFLQALPNGDAGTPKNVTIQNNDLEKTIEGYFSIFLPHHNEGNPEHYENIDIRNNSATQTIAADPRATYTNVQIDGNIAPSMLFWNEATEVDQGLPTGAETEYNVWYAKGAKKYGTHDQLAPQGSPTKPPSTSTSPQAPPPSNTATPTTTPPPTSTAPPAPTPPTPAPPNTPEHRSTHHAGARLRAPAFGIPNGGVAVRARCLAAWLCIVAAGGSQTLATGRPRAQVPDLVPACAGNSARARRRLDGIRRPRRSRGLSLPGAGLRSHREGAPLHRPPQHRAHRRRGPQPRCRRSARTVAQHGLALRSAPRVVEHRGAGAGPRRGRQDLLADHPRQGRDTAPSQPSPGALRRRRKRPDQPDRAAVLRQHRQSPRPRRLPGLRVRDPRDQARSREHDLALELDLPHQSSDRIDPNVPCQPRTPRGTRPSGGNVLPEGNAASEGNERRIKRTKRRTHRRTDGRTHRTTPAARRTGEHHPASDRRHDHRRPDPHHHKRDLGRQPHQLHLPVAELQRLRRKLRRHLGRHNLKPQARRRRCRTHTARRRERDQRRRLHGRDLSRHDEGRKNQRRTASATTRAGEQDAAHDQRHHHRRRYAHRHQRYVGTQPHQIRPPVAGLQRARRRLPGHRRRDSGQIHADGIRCRRHPARHGDRDQRGGSTPATSAKTAVVTAGSVPEEALFVSPTGSDSNPCTEAKPCLTMGHAYQKAASGQTVRLLAGSYPEQHIAGDSSKTSGAHVVFAPASGASVRITGTIYVLGSHLTIEDMAVQDVTIGNYEARNPGRPTPAT